MGTALSISLIRIPHNTYANNILVIVLRSYKYIQHEKEALVFLFHKLSRNNYKILPHAPQPFYKPD